MNEESKRWRALCKKRLSSRFGHGAEIFLGDMNPDVITVEACVAGACFVLLIGALLDKVLKK